MRFFRITGLRNYVITILLLCSAVVSAQSNLTYELKVGTTGEVKVLQEFPESYAGEKINITVKGERLEVRGLEALDFAFANEGTEALRAWGDSVYSFTDEIGTFWTVWQNKKEIKNRAQRVKVNNAYKTFTDYVISHTAAEKRSRGWIWWVFAGLLFVGTVLYGGYILYSRRKEKSLSSVEQETLRRKRMGMRRHFLN